MTVIKTTPYRFYYINITAVFYGEYHCDKQVLYIIVANY